MSMVIYVFFLNCLFTCSLHMHETFGFFLFKFVMMLVVNLSWINQVDFLFVQYLGTALRGGCVLMTSGTHMTMSVLVQNDLLFV